MSRPPCSRADAAGRDGWRWADPVAAVAIAGLVVKEGLDAWRGERDCC